MSEIWQRGCGVRALGTIWICRAVLPGEACSKRRRMGRPWRKIASARNPSQGALYIAALSAMRHGPHFRDFAARPRAKGRSGKQCPLAAASKSRIILSAAAQQADQSAKLSTLVPWGLPLERFAFASTQNSNQFRSDSDTKVFYENAKRFNCPLVQVG